MTSRIAAVPAEDLNAFTLLDISMINCLLDEAQHYAHFENAPSLQAVSRSLGNPLDWLNRYTQPLQVHYPQIDAAKRESVRQQARAQYDAITQRITAVDIERYSAHRWTDETDDEDRSIQLMSSVLTVLAAATAARALAQKVLDRALTLEERWAFLVALHQSALITQANIQALKQGPVPRQQLPLDHELVWLRLTEQMTRVTNDEFPYRPAFVALCADSGVTLPSENCRDYPAAVRFMVAHPQPNRDWELGAWHFDVSDSDLWEIIRFDHQGQRHVKLVHEPYPDGYPSDLVKDQMVNLLRTLDEHADHSDPAYRTNFATANAMYEAAARDLHTRSHVHLTGFMEELRGELSNPAIADWLFRSATGYNQDLGRLLAPPRVEPHPLVKPDQAVALLSAGCASGMDNTQLWELALLLGANPADHGIVVPVVGVAEMKSLEKAARSWGIPRVMMDRWRRLLESDQEDPV